MLPDGVRISSGLRRERSASLAAMVGCRCLLPLLLVTALSYGCATGPAAPAPSSEVRPEARPEVRQDAASQDVRQDAPSGTSEARPGPTPFLGFDVVLAVDHAAAGLLASGVDVDRDGVVGRNKRWPYDGRELTPTPGWDWTTDGLGDA